MLCDICCNETFKALEITMISLFSIRPNCSEIIWLSSSHTIVYVNKLSNRDELKFCFNKKGAQCIVFLWTFDSLCNYQAVCNEIDHSHFEWGFIIPKIHILKNTLIFVLCNNSFKLYAEMGSVVSHHLSQ